MSLLMSACSAASDAGSSAASGTLPLFDETTTSVPVDAADASEPSALPASTTDVDAGSETESTTTHVGVDQITEPSAGSPSTVGPTTVESTVGPTTTVRSVTTAVPIDPNVEFCRAAIEIDGLGTFTALDDIEAATLYFNAQADRWEAAAIAAPAAIAADTQTVATFNSDLRSLLAANDFNLFAVFEEVTALEVSSGSDVARIRVDQYIYANCEVTPPLPEQATAAFYGQLLDSPEDRTYLAELLASAEVFSLDGAECFVGRATADVMHPLVGAPSTAAQDSALANVLTACQLSIGT